MGREPIGLYIFRLFLSFGLVVFMIMLYWSSTLIEQNVRAARYEINQLKSDVLDLRKDSEKLKFSLEKGIKTLPQDVSQNEEQRSARSKIDASLPNLLEVDSFYAVTLPEILGPDFQPSGTFRNAVMGKPDTLHPFSNWSQVGIWQAQCTVSVARQKFGIYETLSPDMALKMEERINEKTGAAEFWVHLRDGVYWQPLSPTLFSENIKLADHFLKKHQVTAHDFKFYLDVILNPSVQEPGAVALRNYFSDVESLEVIDDLTFVVRWKTEKMVSADGVVEEKIKYIGKMLTSSLRPLACFVYKYFADGKKIVEEDSDPNTYRTNSVWAQNFSKHWAQNIIVSCGPWIFEGMTDRNIFFRRNPDHYFPLDVLVNASEIEFRDNPEAIWQDFKNNRLDYYEIRPDQLIELAAFLKSPRYLTQNEEGNAIRRLDFIGRSYLYIGWNETREYFKSRKVRQALTMAIDRQRIIRQNLNGLGIEITSPFSIYSNAYDKSIQPWPFDPLRAKRILEEEGWYDSNGDGVIDKEINGERVPFRFSLTYYVKNPTTKAICEYISTALKEIGIIANLNGVDIADLSAVFEGKSFDALCMGWALGTPPEDPKQLWYSSGANERGSSNAIGFANPEVDKIIDLLQYESDKEERIALYHRFDEIIHDEAPYVFLYTPKTVFLYREYLKNVFIPAERQDLVPGADVAQPDSSVFYLRK